MTRRPRFVVPLPAALCVLLLSVSPARADVLVYAGTWFNQTFMSTGPASATIERNLPQVTFTLDLDGNVFGGSNPTPLVMNGMLNPDMSVTFAPVVGHPTYGDVTGSMSATGAINAAGTNVPGGFITGVTLTGQRTPTDIDLSYVVTFAQGAPANGVINMDLIPEPALGASAAFVVLLGGRRARHPRPTPPRHEA